MSKVFSDQCLFNVVLQKVRDLAREVEAKALYHAICLLMFSQVALRAKY